MSAKIRKFALGAVLLVGLGAVAAWAAGAFDQDRTDAASTDVIVPALPDNEKTQLGLMTSLPLYWPLGADVSGLLDDASEPPWQRMVLEARYDLRLLDTLSASGDAALPPLDGLSQLAIIQPRGLSPQDNVALDEWVRAGGRLLLVLDPVLTGHYELALGDPRLPSMAALIPPVVERWGLTMSFDEGQDGQLLSVPIPSGQSLSVHLAGELSGANDAVQSCVLQEEGALAQCEVGAGRVTILADAAVFEHQELAGQDGATLAALFDYAFDVR